MSEQAKHTPEPWTIDSPYTVRTEDGKFVCKVSMHSRGSVRESENFATNLLFIAAAPKTAAERDRLLALNAEMLGVLERMYSAAVEGIELFHVLKAVIAKAKERNDVPEDNRTTT